MRGRHFPGRQFGLLCSLLLAVLTTISRGEESVSSDSPKNLEVNIWVVEVPIDKLRNVGFTWSQLTPSGAKETSGESIKSITQFPISVDQFLPFLKSLEQNNLAHTLCKPTLATLDGRPASLEISPYLELDVVPIVLGSGNARLEYRLKIFQDSTTQDATKEHSQTSPRPVSFKTDAAAELELGKVSLLSHTRIDKPTTDGKSQSTEMLVLARVDVMKQGTLPTGK